MATTMRFLISGNGVAGQVAAYWLARLGADITVIDKAPGMRVNGQGIDIRTVGVEVVRRMGIEKAIRDATTGEAGTQFVNDKGRAIGTFPEDEGLSFTSDIEIQRGDLIRVINSALPSSINYRYSTSIVDLDEKPDAVTVTFDNGKSEDFDMVIAAEGLGSVTRKILQDQGALHGNWDGTTEAVRRFGCAIGLFTFPRPAWHNDFAQIYNIGGGRNACVRPVGKDSVGGYLGIIDRTRSEDLRQLCRAAPDVQKKRLREEFSGGGWRIPELLDAMDASDDFYLQEVGQVYLSKWSSPRGRVALIGDAASCPSLFTGMGTTCAIYGAYALAARVAAETRKADGKTVDFAAACAGYEAEVRPLLTKTQKLPPGVPWIVNPTSRTGVLILRAIVSIASMLAPVLGKLAKPFSSKKQEKHDIPDFDEGSARALSG